MINALRFNKTLNYWKHRNQKNIIFIWIPKTAGTSLMEAINEIVPVQQYLEVKEIKNSFPNTGFSTFGHISLRALLDNNIVSTSYYSRAKTFCVSRNPYDRFISLYHYSKKVNRIPKELTIEEFINQIEKGIPNIGLYNVRRLSQCQPQITWVKDIKVDKIFKFESLIQNTDSVFEYLGIKPNEISHLNKSHTRKSFTEELTKSQIKFINSYYEADFRYFGYPLKY